MSASAWRYPATGRARLWCPLFKPQIALSG
jgi:hypothetical protein